MTVNKSIHPFFHRFRIFAAQLNFGYCHRNNWSASVRNLPNVSSAEEKTYMEIFAAEGGNRPDSSGTAVGGILQVTLDELVSEGYVKGVKPGTTPNHLSIQKRAEMYRGYINRALKNAGGSPALSRIGDPEVSAALSDSLFMHGNKRGAILVQKAANDVIPKRVLVDGWVGNKTIDAYKSLAADPAQRRRLLDALARQRLDFIKNDPKFNGKKTRIDHFRFQKSP